MSKQPSLTDRVERLADRVSDRSKALRSRFNCSDVYIEIDPDCRVAFHLMIEIGRTIHARARWMREAAERLGMTKIEDQLRMIERDAEAAKDLGHTLFFKTRDRDDSERDYEAPHPQPPTAQ